MKKRISLKDIANKLGVSTALVSYALNNKKEGRISKDMAEKIKETARDLNYRGNLIAKSLKTQKTFTIGLIVADISNPFWSGLARIIEDEAEKNNYTVLFGSSDENADKSEKLLQVLVNHQVDGLIIAPTEHSLPQIEFLQQNEIPFVLVDRYFPDINASYVAIDNYSAAFNLVNHVIEQGFKRIGFITFTSNLFHLQERKRGYLSCLEQNNIATNEDWIKEVSLDNTKDDVTKAINELLALPDPIEVILFASNELSRYGLKYIVTLPLKVPDDLAIISFDESDAAELFYSPITYIKQPIREIGEAAIKIILENIEDNNKLTQLSLLPEFILQKSSLKSIAR